MKSENKDTAYEHKSITVKKRIRTIKKESPGITFCYLIYKVFDAVLLSNTVYKSFVAVLLSNI